MINMHELAAIEHLIFDITIRYVYHMYIHQPCSVIPIALLSSMALCKPENTFDISQVALYLVDTWDDFTSHQ